MLKYDQILKNQNDLFVEFQITKESKDELNEIINKLNDELNQIIPNILPDSIFCYNFIISNSSLHK